MEQNKVPQNEQKIVSEEPTTEYKTSPYAKSYKKNWKKWLLIYLVIGLVLYGLIYYFVFAKNGSNPYSQNYSYTPTTAPVSPAADATANWKVYSSSKDFLSLKYPTDWQMTVQPITATNYETITLVSVTSSQVNIVPMKAIPGQDISSNWQPNTNLVIGGISCGGVKVSFTPKMQNPPNTAYECITNGIMYDVTVVPTLNQDHTEDYSAVNQILSTLQFTDQTSQSSVEPTVSAAIPLTYNLPAGWKTVQDADGTFEVGYNPQINHPATDQVTNSEVIIMPNDGGSYRYSLSLDDYDGGSRHNFIWNGSKPDITLPSYTEKNYIYTSWSCLVLYGASYSQSPQTNGMCAVSNNKALRIGNYSLDQSETEQIIQTIRLLKTP